MKSIKIGRIKFTPHKPLFGVSFRTAQQDYYLIKNMIKYRRNKYHLIGGFLPHAIRE